MGVGGEGLFTLLLHLLHLLLKHITGGGKCPEEEHTTCSGGPTILVTSAVYGEKEYFVKYYILQNVKKRENNIFMIKYKIFYERIKCKITAIYP